MTLTAEQRRVGWFVLLVTAVMFRLFIPVVLKPVGYIADWNDYYFFESWARFTDRGLYPYLHFWMEHPPLFPWLVVVAYRISAVIPAWHDPHLAFSLVFGTILLIFEIGNLLLIGRIARRVGGLDAGLVAAWLYALLFAPVFFWSAGFECYPLFFLLLTVEWTLAALERRGRGARAFATLAGIAAGVGIMVKLLPALALPVSALALWRAGQRAAAALLVGVALATASAILTPFAVANPTMTLASAQSLFARSGWETPWALLEGYYSGGSVARPEARLDPATATQADRPSFVPMAPILVVAGVIGLVAVARGSAAVVTPAGVVSGVGLTIALFLLANKGYSPQFLVYMLAPVVARWPNGRGVWFAIAFSAVNLVEYPLALLLFADQPAVLVATVLLRTALLIALGVAFTADLWRVRLAISGRVATAALTAILLILVGVTASATATYAATRAAIDTQAEAVATLRAQRGATALFTDRYLYDRLTPQLRDAVTPRLVRADLPPRLPVGAREVWEVWAPSDEGERAAPSLARFLADRAFLVEQRVVSDLVLRRMIVAAPESVQARGALGPFALVGAAMPVTASAGGLLPVALDWRTSGDSSSGDLKLFIHVIDDRGALVAQRDVRFASTFADGALDRVRAREALTLPSSLLPGAHTVRVGVYDAVTGQRVNGATGDSIVIGQLEVAR